MTSQTTPDGDKNDSGMISATGTDQTAFFDDIQTRSSSRVAYN